MKCPPIYAFLVIGGMVLFQVVYALATGKLVGLSIYGGAYLKDKQPFRFWLSIWFYVFCFFAFTRWITFGWILLMGIDSERYFHPAFFK